MAAMVSLDIVPLSGGNSHAEAGAQPIVIAYKSACHLAFMRTSLSFLLGRGMCTRGTSARLTPRVRAFVGVDDFAAGGEPHALVLLHFGERTLEIFDAQGLPADHRMQGNTHHPRLLRAVGQELLELVHHGPEILLAGIAF